MLDPSADDAVATVKSAIVKALAASTHYPSTAAEAVQLTDAIFAAIFRPEVRWATVVVGTMPGATTDGGW